MRLLKLSSEGSLSLTEDLDNIHIPSYAILSHTWGADGDEVTFDDMQNERARNKPGYAKLEFCAERAREDRIDHFWVDTCCINKANLTELSEAITSMFRWYQDAAKCYVYLTDVSSRKQDVNDATATAWEGSFLRSRWFTRGWTLQELLAPKTVQFFSQERELLGSKTSLLQQIAGITGVPRKALEGTPLTRFTVDEKLRWAKCRQTKKPEDKAYSLFGIFDVSLPVLYGEGEEAAFYRLKKDINERHGV